MNTQKALNCSVLAVCLSIVLPVQAATYSAFGSFSKDDDRAFIPLRVTSSGMVTVQTWSFAGGVTASGLVVAPGGFAVTLSLFDSSDSLIGLAQAGIADCGLASVDAATGFCWDVTLSSHLDTGSYNVILTEDDNIPLGDSLSDGFSREGQADFTGQNYLGTSSTFILPGGSQRSSQWALDINGPIMSPVPEPDVAGLLTVGLLTVLGFGRLKRLPY